MVDAAELFEAISHPARIRILKALEKQPSSFASLKRQLGIDSSGNLDYHLKKLGQLVTVRQDGLYALTDVGKEALLSIDAVEMWTDMERHKAKMFTKMPKEALSLGLLEICTTVSILVFFLTLVQLPQSTDNPWGFLFFGALLFTGFCSGFGIFVRWRWSWIMVLAKSALIMSMGLFLLNYLWKPELVIISQSSSVALCYLAFVAAEIATVVVALRHPLKDFLGISKIKLSYLDVFSSLLCISSGLLLVLLESAVRFPIAAELSSDPVRVVSNFSWVSTVFTSVSDTSILCGLLIMVGGVLILVGSSTIGAVISIIFGFFPPLPYTHHVYDIIAAMPTLPYALVIAVLVGSLPIVGGLLALAGARRLLR
ncbi:MAG: winged helix-turn-helix domain-containing protein [Candidatus Bathyarchaeia archaeon]|jgi:DNA-binding HxlR family transcriptional regulator